MVLVERYGREYVSAARGIGRRLGKYKVCLRRESDGEDIVSASWILGADTVVEHSE